MRPLPGVWRASFLHPLTVRFTMTEVTESAESKQLLESLKGRMLVLKEHL
jgi:hypothetical protein